FKHNSAGARCAPFAPRAGLPQRSVGAAPPGNSPSPRGQGPTAVCRNSALAANGVPSTPREPPFPPRAGLPQRGVGAAPPLRTACKARPGNSPSPTGKAPTEGWQYQEHCRSGAGTPDRPAANGVPSTPNRLTTTTRQPHENWLYRTG